MPIIGRGPPAEIIVSEPQVSERHAEIVHLRADLYQITDLGSRNGTFVNGKRVRTAEIRLSDDIALGSFELDLQPYRDIIRPSAPAESPASAPVQPDLKTESADLPTAAPGRQEPSGPPASPKEHPRLSVGRLDQYLEELWQRVLRAEIAFAVGLAALVVVAPLRSLFRQSAYYSFPHRILSFFSLAAILGLCVYFGVVLVRQIHSQRPLWSAQTRSWAPTLLASIRSYALLVASISLLAVGLLVPVFFLMGSTALALRLPLAPVG